MLTLLRENEGTEEAAPRRLRLTAHRERAASCWNSWPPRRREYQDRIALLGEGAAAGEQIEHEVFAAAAAAIRLVGHHQQYHDTDILTVRVDAENRSPI